MDLRKVTRNPGWWRLFIVFVGLWYGGWLIGAVVTFSEDIFNRGRVVTDPVLIAKLETLAESGYQSVDEIRQAFYKASEQGGDKEEASRFAELVTRIEGSPPNIFDQFDSEPEYPFADLIPPEPWYRDIDLLGTIAAIISFPWLVYFNLRLMRYVIEGFIPERE